MHFHHSIIQTIQNATNANSPVAKNETIKGYRTSKRICLLVYLGAIGSSSNSGRGKIFLLSIASRMAVTPKKPPSQR
jgi:hypothetical protein